MEKEQTLINIGNLTNKRCIYLANKYGFNGNWVKKKIKFFKEQGYHVQGEKVGKPFIPNEWQLQNIIYPIFGLEKNGKRLINRSYIQTPKKTGKSTLMANIEFMLLLTESRGKDELYNVAGDDAQANLLFSIAASVAKKSDFASQIKVLDHTGKIFYGESFIHRLNAKSETKEGINPFMVIYDEIHVAPNRKLYDNIKKAFGHIPNNIFFIISTPGTDKNSVCYELYDYSNRIEKGTIEDDNFWYAILEAYPKEEDIFNIEHLQEVNPLYNESGSLKESIKSDIVEAVNSPANENSFRRYRLGQWTQAETRWMNTEVIEACYNPDLSEEDYHGEQCYIGLDFASTQDMVGYTNLILTENTYKWFCRLWIPEKAATKYEKKFNIPYLQWAKEGWITIVPGNIISFEEDVEPVINKNIKNFAVRSMGYDPSYGAGQMALRLQNNLGLEVNKVLQGFKMHPGIDKMSELFKGIRIEFNNPILKWQFDNVLLMVGNYDAKTRLIKPQDEKKIDGIVSGVMAVFESLMRDPEEEATDIMIW